MLQLFLPIHNITDCICADRWLIDTTLQYTLRTLELFEMFSYGDAEMDGCCWDRGCETDQVIILAFLRQLVDSLMLKRHHALFLNNVAYNGEIQTRIKSS